MQDKFTLKVSFDVKIDPNKDLGSIDWHKSVLKTKLEPYGAKNIKMKVAKKHENPT